MTDQKLPVNPFKDLPGSIASYAVDGRFVEWNLNTWRRAVEIALQQSRGFRPIDIPFALSEHLRTVQATFDLMGLSFNNPLEMSRNIGWDKAFADAIKNAPPPYEWASDVAKAAEELNDEEAKKRWEKLEGLLDAIDEKPIKGKKNKRIAALEAEVEELRMELLVSVTARERLIGKMEDIIAGKLAEGKQYFTILDGTVRPMIGEIVYGTYDGQRVLLWNNGGNWFIQSQGFGTHGQIAPDLIKDIKWFKIISQPGK